MNKDEGEVEPTAEAGEITAADAAAPAAASQTPAAAPPQPTEEGATQAPPSEVEKEGKDSIQEAVDRTNASKSGQIGSLEGEPEEASKRAD